jgi:hypothetical protein
MIDFQNVIKTYGDHSFGLAVVLSVIFWVLFIGRYMAGKEMRSVWLKMLDVVFMFFYIGLFALYIMVGISIGENTFGSLPIGVCIGVGAFWVMFEILAFIKKKRTKV